MGHLRNRPIDGVRSARRALAQGAVENPQRRFGIDNGAGHKTGLPGPCRAALMSVTSISRSSSASAPIGPGRSLLFPSSLGRTSTAAPASSSKASAAGMTTGPVQTHLDHLAMHQGIARRGASHQDEARRPSAGRWPTMRLLVERLGPCRAAAPHRSRLRDRPGVPLQRFLPNGEIVVPVESALRSGLF